MIIVVAELLLEPVLVSRGGKGDDCQWFEEFGIWTRSDEFYIELLVPQKFEEEGGDELDSFLEGYVPEVVELVDVVEPDLMLVLILPVTSYRQTYP